MRWVPWHVERFGEGNFAPGPEATQDIILMLNRDWMCSPRALSFFVYCDRFYENRGVHAEADRIEDFWGEP